MKSKAQWVKHIYEVTYNCVNEALVYVRDSCVSSTASTSTPSSNFKWANPDRNLPQHTNCTIIKRIHCSGVWLLIRGVLESRRHKCQSVRQMPMQKCYSRLPSQISAISQECTFGRHSVHDKEEPSHYSGRSNNPTSPRHRVVLDFRLSASQYLK